MRKLRANPVKVVEEVFPLSRFTDDGAASGHADFTNKIPAGAVVLGWKADTTTPFTGGATTASTISVGKSGGANDYSQVTTNSVFTAGKDYSNAPVATALVQAATAPRVTVTDGSAVPDFTAFTKGTVKVTVFYVDLEAKAI